MASRTGSRHSDAHRGHGCPKFAALIALLPFCVIVEGCGQSNNFLGTKHTQSQAACAPDQEPFLMPYMEGSGIALICARDELLGSIETTLLDYPEGVPFSRLPSQGRCAAVELQPNPPDIAIWNDRTIFWATTSMQGETSFWIGRIGAREHGQLLSLIDTLSINSGFMDSDPDVSNPASSNVVGTVSVVGARYKWVLATELPQMEESNKYWILDDNILIDLPMAEYSFEEYCSKLSPLNAIHVTSYATLHSTLKALNPSDARQVDVSEMISWVVQTGPRLGVRP